MPSMSVFRRPCLKCPERSIWHKDKPFGLRGRHNSTVSSNPWAPYLLGTLILTSLLLSILGLLRIHETLDIAVQLKAADDFSLPSEPGLVETVQHRLLLATHNVLAWYYPQYDVMEVLHQGEGVHYGMFPGDSDPRHPLTVWNVIRPHNWRPETEKEYLVRFDAVTGEELKRVEIPSRFSHDAIRVGDFVYVCSTGNGNILQLRYPDMKLVASHQLFSVTDHPNTLAAASGPNGDQDHLWVVLHNLGASDLVKVYIGPSQPAHEVLRIKNIGQKAHGCVSWGSTGDLIMLDSENGVLVSLNPETRQEFELWKVPEGGKFLKGLAVLDDIAYFGIATWSKRSIRDSPDSHGELAAFDLVKNKLIWRRVVSTSGLLNIIGTPHLAQDSTFTATYTPTPLPTTKASGLTHAGHNSPDLVLPDSKALVLSVLTTLQHAGFKQPALDPAGYWSSGWPRLDIRPKLTDHPEVAGLQLPLFHADVTALKDKLSSLPDHVWSKDFQAESNVMLNGRHGNMERFKPGVEGIMLLFSDNAGDVVYQFPYYEAFRDVLEPLLQEVLGPVDVHNIVRIQFAKMAAGTSDIKMHVDSGGYAKHGHRIHIPIITHHNVAFKVCPYELQGGQTPNEKLLSAAAAAAAAAGDPTALAAAIHSAPAPARGSGRQLTQQQQQQQSAWRTQQMWEQRSQRLQQSGMQAPVQQQQLMQAAGQLPDSINAVCVQLPAPEGLVFELNNRVPHKVSNPGPGIRIHLVIDVFEEHRSRTILPAGSACEYGNTFSAATQLPKIIQQLQQGVITAEQLADEVQVLITSPGMMCNTREGLRVVPKAGRRDKQGLEETQQRQDELMRAVLAGMEPDQQQQFAEQFAALLSSQQDSYESEQAADDSDDNISNMDNADVNQQISDAKPVLQQYDAANYEGTPHDNSATTAGGQTQQQQGFTAGSAAGSGDGLLKTPHDSQSSVGRKVINGYYEAETDELRLPS